MLSNFTAHSRSRWASARLSTARKSDARPSYREALPGFFTIKALSESNACWKGSRPLPPFGTGAEAGGPQEAQTKAVMSRKRIWWRYRVVVLAMSGVLRAGGGAGVRRGAQQESCCVVRAGGA